MAVHIRIETTDNNDTHFIGENSYTLCGLETCGDETMGIEKGTVVKKKVNCPDCVEIVNYCKSIKNSEIDK